MTLTTMRVNRKDYTGDVYGGLTCLEHVGHAITTPARHQLWRVRCSVCGSEEAVFTTHNLRSRLPQHCGCQSGAHRSAANIRRHASTAPDTTAVLLRQVQKYRRAARARGYVWTLTDQEAMSLLTGSCYLCNSPPSRTVKSQSKHLKPTEAVCNGIDRINNDLGYVPDNVKSCCWTCNSMKGTMPLSLFLSQVRRLAAANTLP